MELRVPLDNEQVVQPRAHGYVYQRVKELLDVNLEGMKNFLSGVRPWLYSEEINRVPQEKVDEVSPFWNNGYFSGDDARLAYAITRAFRPRKIIEIGSGNSTKFFRKAIQDGALATKLTSIDPQPRAEIDSISDRIIRRSVLDAELGIFDELAEGDILFFDGSHLVFNGTDTTRFFLEVLPGLKKGILVHIHDIMLPWEYIEEFTRRGYNEQYMLATLLLNSQEWRPLAPVPYLFKVGELKIGGTSFWMRK